MLLKNKNAVIYGGGAIGGAVARVFAREGADRGSHLGMVVWRDDAFHHQDTKAPRIR
jgi:NAD(P)-dependent dehydrogenase (short-subunit alcohol dehydrogenase family)